MAWLNEHDIEHALEVLPRYAPEVVPYARYLNDFKDAINACSDGWAYWRAGTRCADKLGDLVQKSMDAARERRPMPSKAEFDKALTPIKAACSRHKELKVPTLVLDEEPSASPRI